ncbi:hypothetical protein BJV77DRAFT_352434 [Russula vinacea]|nr:hypothetical protein BJV77DRAFT_352434 [Russula vinacea]
MVRSITRKQNIITMQGALILRVDLRRKSSWHFATHAASPYAERAIPIPCWYHFDTAPGADDAAIIIEPVPGEGGQSGFVSALPAFLRGRRHCD